LVKTVYISGVVHVYLGGSIKKQPHSTDIASFYC